MGRSFSGVVNVVGGSIGDIDVHAAPTGTNSTTSECVAMQGFLCDSGFFCMCRCLVPAIERETDEVQREVVGDEEALKRIFLEELMHVIEDCVQKLAV